MPEMQHQHRDLLGPEYSSPGDLSIDVLVLLVWLG